MICEAYEVVNEQFGRFVEKMGVRGWMGGLPKSVVVSVCTCLDKRKEE